MELKGNKKRNSKKSRTKRIHSMELKVEVWVTGIVTWSYPSRESIQWNWKLYNDVGIIIIILSAGESIQWNWKLRRAIPQAATYFRIHSMELKEVWTTLYLPTSGIHSMELKVEMAKKEPIMVRNLESIQWNWKPRPGPQPRPRPVEVQESIQ